MKQIAGQQTGKQGLRQDCKQTACNTSRAMSFMSSVGLGAVAWKRTENGLKKLRGLCAVHWRQAHLLPIACDGAGGFMNFNSGRSDECCLECFGGTGSSQSGQANTRGSTSETRRTLGTAVFFRSFGRNSIESRTDVHALLKTFPGDRTLQKLLEKRTSACRESMHRCKLRTKS